MIFSFVLFLHFKLSQALSFGCSTAGVTSCQTTTTPSNTCCTEYPSGLRLLLQTQDTNVFGSPANSWTIHGEQWGLENNAFRVSYSRQGCGMITVNSCDGTYLENCDPSRDYDISKLLTEQGATSTLDYMQKYWLNGDGTNEELWDVEIASIHARTFLPPIW